MLLGIAAAGSAALLISANRSGNLTRDFTNQDTQIDANLDLVRGAVAGFTCCSGTCTTTAPTGVSATTPCVTTDRSDDRFYFPQLSTGATITVNGVNVVGQPAAVEEWCKPANNTFFMTPVKNAADAVAASAGSTRTSAILADKVLQVTFTSTATGQVTRVENVVPPMAYFCP
ncbi:hypothetical protein [Cyanobium sp. Morenito 9A2]|uniref:hypothetical protein n=1 Tax=Cyanobium sp. Morenito 9A2 TaxID=2823718 RepID=UPI0020CCA8D5|nr:hypothetical protein [Cyanobium sp. Morenito 9A2]